MTSRIYKRCLYFLDNPLINLIEDHLMSYIVLVFYYDEQKLIYNQTKSIFPPNLMQIPN